MRQRACHFCNIRLWHFWNIRLLKTLLNQNTSFSQVLAGFAFFSEGVIIAHASPGNGGSATSGIERVVYRRMQQINIFMHIVRHCTIRFYFSLLSVLFFFVPQESLTDKLAQLAFLETWWVGIWEGFWGGFKFDVSQKITLGLALPCSMWYILTDLTLQMCSERPCYIHIVLC